MVNLPSTSLEAFSRRKAVETALKEGLVKSVGDVRASLKGSGEGFIKEVGVTAKKCAAIPTDVVKGGLDATTKFLTLQPINGTVACARTLKSAIKDIVAGAASIVPLTTEAAGSVKHGAGVVAHGAGNVVRFPVQAAKAAAMLPVTAPVKAFNLISQKATQFNRWMSKPIHPESEASSQEASSIPPTPLTTAPAPQKAEASPSESSEPSSAPPMQAAA